MSVDLVKNWDPNKFNVSFEDYKKNLQELQEKEDEKELNKMSKEIKERKISEMSFQELSYNWKYSMMNIINDAIHLNISKNTFEHENSLFYFGSTILFFVILFYILYSLYNLLKTDNIKKIVYEHHYYHK